jgi:hypothetical protein
MFKIGRDVFGKATSIVWHGEEFHYTDMEGFSEVQIEHVVGLLNGLVLRYEVDREADERAASLLTPP